MNKTGERKERGKEARIMSNREREREERRQRTDQAARVERKQKKNKMRDCEVQGTFVNCSTFDSCTALSTFYGDM